MKKLLIILMIFASVTIFNSCEKEGATPTIPELQQELEELKALLEGNTEISEVSFEGSVMILKFSNGTVVRTEAPVAIMPYVGENGNWWVNGNDMGVKAEAEMPSIGSNGNWWIGDSDTGVKAEGTKGDNGSNGVNGTDGTGISVIDYDPNAAILSITLTDETEYEFVLFYEETLQGIKLGDLNGKYLLSGIAIGDMPFAKFVYNTNNQLTDINYFTAVFNAPVKTASLHREYNSENKIESQKLTEIATVEKAVPIGYYLPGNTYNGLKLTAQEAFDEIFPSGLANYTGTAVNFFSEVGIIQKGGYIYQDYYWSGEDNNTVLKSLVQNDESKLFGISELNNQIYIWGISYYNTWNNQLYGNNRGGNSALSASSIVIGTNNSITGTYNGYNYFSSCCPAIEVNSNDIDDISGNKIYDYIAIENDNIENPESISGDYKVLLREYDIYQAGDEIQSAIFNYSYNGDDITASYDGDNIYTIEVVNDRIDKITLYDGEDVIDLLKLNYTDTLLTSISSPYHEVVDVVKISHDERGNPIEYTVNSKELSGKNMDDALAMLGLAVKTKAYDSELGMVIEKYLYPEDYTPLIKVKYDYTMKNFMNHTLSAVNPLLSVFNQENSIQELNWAGHGSCFVAEYLSFNDGGYPTEFKGYLQVSFQDFDEDFDTQSGTNLPVNISVATRYKLSYIKIEE
jgi:hypothetical protein